MSSRIKSLLFAAALCFCLSVLLTTASTGLQRFQAQNVRIDKQKNVLKSAGIIEPTQSYSAAEIEKLYTANIEPKWVTPEGRLVVEQQRGTEDFPLYIYEKDNRLEAYIVPINSRGLWGPIRGYLALEDDGSTVKGFTVYQHSETPGLGGEIEKRWFQKNWVGKKIVNRSGEFVSIGIAKGDVEEQVPPDKQPNYVDGISGATLTGKYLTAGIRDTLSNYEPVSIRLRNDSMPSSPDGDEPAQEGGP